MKKFREYAIVTATRSIDGRFLASENRFPLFDGQNYNCDCTGYIKEYSSVSENVTVSIIGDPCAEKISETRISSISIALPRSHTVVTPKAKAFIAIHRV